MPNTKDAPLIESLATEVKPENAKLTVEITTILGKWVLSHMLHNTQHVYYIYLYIYMAPVHKHQHTLYCTHPGSWLHTHLGYYFTERERKKANRHYIIVMPYHTRNALSL